MLGKSAAERDREFNPKWHETKRPDACVHFLDSGGAGRPVILLHGLAGHAGEWLGTMRYLHPRWRTLALDQRGHGRSTRMPDDLSREAFADDVAAVIKASSLERQVVLIGQSMGAHTALITAARYPHLVSHLVMIEGDVGGGGSDHLAALGQTLESWPIPFPNYQSAMHFFRGDNELGRSWADGFEQRADGLWPRWDVEVMVRTMAPVFARESWQEWASLLQPTLLVLGQNGKIDRGRVKQMLEHRPSAQRVIIEQAGHDLHLEQPQAWLHTLEAFLA